MSITAGVIAVQGDVPEHVAAIHRAAERVDRSVTVRPIREAGIVPDCDWVAMPGGESTAISRLVHESAIATELCDHVAAGKPLLATCAGLIVAASEPNDDRVTGLGLLEASVERNAFGRQADSFETALSVDGLESPFHAVFIRAPVIESVGEAATVLARHEGRPVAVRQGPVVGTAFHPELTDDARIHRLTFLEGD